MHQTGMKVTWKSLTMMWPYKTPSPTTTHGTTASVNPFASTTTMPPPLSPTPVTPLALIPLPLDHLLFDVVNGNTVLLFTWEIYMENMVNPPNR
jgi:hypothetical protein